jgi:hypothetical protein
VPSAPAPASYYPPGSYPPPAHQPTAYPAAGYPESSYPTSGYPSPAYPTSGYPPPAYSAQSYPPGYGYRPVYATSAPPPTSGLAIASMVIGIIAVFGCWTVILPALAIILGHVAMRETRMDKGGHGMAVAGVVLGHSGLALFLLALLLNHFDRLGI